MGAQGGAGAPVPNCQSYDSKRRCGTCKNSKFLVSYSCVTSCQDSDNARTNNNNGIGYYCAGEVSTDLPVSMSITI